MQLTFKRCIADDIHALRDFSYRTYNETFAHMNLSSNMEAYLEQSLSVDKLCTE
jgi:hypothetical protein